MSDFAESIFDSVSIIVDKKLDELAFDTTIICRIINNSECKNGKYKVSDGSVTYDAYSEVQDYEEGETVRVAIPNNDYARRKFILGRYGEDDMEDSKPITYISSTDNAVNISGNLVNWDNAQNTGIIINGPAETVLVWEKAFESEELEYLQNSGIYNTLLLEADFQTFMGNHIIKEGTYGLYVELFIHVAEIDQYIRKTATFSSSEMFGNPYSFNISSKQSKIFPIESVEGVIHGIRLFLYQDNNFKDENGIITYENSLGEKVYPATPQIQVNNVMLGFGSNITGIADNVLQIYTPNRLEYKYHLPTDTTNRKKIGLVWYNKNEFDKYLGFSDGYYDNIYDEIQYLNISKVDSRLTAQMQKENTPTDKYGLCLSADLEELGSLINQAGTLITSDLTTVLNNFNNELAKIIEYRIIDEESRISNDEADRDKGRAINDQLLLIKNNFSTEKIEPIKTSFYNDQKLYKSLLKSVNEKKPCEDVDANGDLIEIIPDLNRYSGDEYFITQEDGTIDSTDEDKKHLGFNGIINQINTILLQLKTDITTYFASYLGTFDIYEIRINRVITKIQRVLEKFPTVNILTSFPEDFYKADDTRVDTITYKDYLFYYNYADAHPLPSNPDDLMHIFFGSLSSYEAMDFSAYGQKYCIYWYKYNPGYTIIDNYSFLGENWKRLEDFNNVGRPEANDDPLMNPVFCNKENEFFEQYMDPTLKEQKYKAVLFYDHVMYTSNELVFTNQDEIPNTAAIDKADGLSIEHLSESFDVYPLYNESNWLQDSKNASIARQIRCHFNGLKVGDKEILPGAGIYWYVPESSMITYNQEHLIQRGFTTDLEDETKHSSQHYKPGYVCFYKKIYDSVAEVEEGETPSEITFNRLEGEAKISCDTRDFWYWIRDYYEPNAGQNHIICRMIPKDSDLIYETKVYFSFGLMGTNGTSHTLIAINKDSKQAVQEPFGEDDGSLVVRIELRDANNRQIEISLEDAEENENKVAIEEIMYTGQGLVVRRPPGSDTDNLEKNELKFIPPSNKLPACEIIKMTLKDYQVEENKKVSLSSTHAIPWSKGKYRLSGITKIVYNSLGVLDKNEIFNIEYHLYNINDGSEVLVDKSRRLKWRSYLCDKSGHEITSGPLYNQYISFKPEISCRTQWVEITININEIQDILNSIVIGTSLNITDEQFQKLILFSADWASYFEYNESDHTWKFIKDNIILDQMKKLIVIDRVGSILADIQSSLGVKPVITANDYNTLINHRANWNVHFVSKAISDTETKYEFIGTSAIVEAMISDTADNNAVKTILNAIEAGLSAKPTISTTHHDILISHNISWSLYFEENSEGNWVFIESANVLTDMINNKEFINKIVEQKIENTNLLVPAPMYSQGLGTECFVVVEGYDKNPTNGNETIYWQQPIIISQSHHESPMLNEWDGNFVIDKDNKYIMSTMLGAGYKNADNTYNGVLMGDLAITELVDGRDSDRARSLESRMVGLYGFHEGAQSFGFRVDGTAFMGKAGAGRIEFNGNTGVIQSGNYIASNGKMGMQIDLTNGHIDAYNFKLTSNRIILNSDIDASSYLTVYGDTDQTQTLISIGKTDYYLQSKSYADGTVTNAWTTALDNNGDDDNIVTFLESSYPAGMKIDLTKGSIYASPGLAAGGLTIDSSAQTTEGKIVLAAGSNFAIDCLGNFKARGNWELWCDVDGKTGLRSDGVYSGAEINSVTGNLSLNTDYKWTSWDELAGVARSFMEQDMWNIGLIVGVAVDAAIAGLTAVISGMVDAAIATALVATNMRISGLEGRVSALERQ